MSPAGDAPLIPDGLDATLVLLRHGETRWIVEGRFQGGADIELSPLGERQAQLAAGRLADPTRSPVLPIPTGLPLEIVHSPLVRASRGAALVAEAMGRRAAGSGGSGGSGASGSAAVAPPLRADASFRELGQGVWEGMFRTEIEARYPEELRAWRRTPHLAYAPEGEPVPDVAARATVGLRDLLARLDAVPKSPTRSQGTAGYPPPAAPDTPWTLLVGHDGVFKTVMCTLFGMPLERFWTWPFGLAGISVVEFRAGMPVLRAHNLTEHLAPLLDAVAIGETEERQRSGAL